MTPHEILTTVENFLPSAANSTLCSIEKGCKVIPQCSSGSTHVVIDFDSVKEVLCKQKRQAPLASVDALTISPVSNTLLLVEIKSWKKVAINPVTKEETNDEGLKQIAEKFKRKKKRKCGF
ncbi:MAG: hypothetical protein HDS49_05100, partial [Bacteroides sp.]|nr:hypothetical protein [Bacteroides sp.]